jgi:hypothetical protein
MKTTNFITNILFIIILIGLLIIFIYLNKSNYENFTNVAELMKKTAEETSTIEPKPAGAIDFISSDISTTIDTVIRNEEIPDPIKDGRNFKRALPTAEFAKYLTIIRRADKTIDKSKIPVYGNGYYWINIPYIGPQYIYCIMDQAFLGGGWMLALRGIKNSKTFSFDSSYYTTDNTFNNDAKYIINTIFKDAQKYTPTEDLSLPKFSSIGDLIFKLDAKQSTQLSDTFDAKFHTFNYFPAREWMCIFYKMSSKSAADKQYKLTGLGDLRGNPRGYVWHEKNVNYEGIVRTPLELFNYLDSIASGANGQVGNKSRRYDLRPFYGNVRAENIQGKWIGGDPSAFNIENYFFGAQRPGFNFYGINYRPALITSNTTDATKIRWGFAFNNVVTNDDGNDPTDQVFLDESDELTNNVFSGIGLSFPGESSTGQLSMESGFSAGDFFISVDNYTGKKITDLSRYGPKDNTTREIGKSAIYNSKNPAGVNESIAFEWYVR